MVAGSHLLVPFKADDSSRVATRALFALLYGSNPPHPVYGRYTFASRASQAVISIQLCHIFIGNQFTQYRGSAAVFRSMSDAVIAELYFQYLSTPTRYTNRGPIHDQENFKTNYIYELRDFNSAGVVAAHLGKPLSRLSGSTYQVHGNEVSLDRGRIRACSDSIHAVVRLL
jgi:hypothetical protein